MAETPDPLWYKDAVIYQAHVRAFFDSSDDGVGDFAGLTQKLEYVESLGVNTIWLLPFYPSPLRDDGYDIADYENIHPSYGTLADFDRFIEEAHRRQLRVHDLLSDERYLWRGARNYVRLDPGSRVAHILLVQLDVPLPPEPALED